MADALNKLLDEGKKWTLLQDSMLCAYLDEHVNKMLEPINELDNKLNQLKIESELLTIRLGTIHNNICALKSSKLVEERIADVFPTTKTTNAERRQHRLRTEESNERMTAVIQRAIKNGFAMIDDYFNEVQLVTPDFYTEVDPNFSPHPVFEVVNPYANRPLPALIGTNEFQMSSTVGLTSSQLDTDNFTELVECITVKLPQTEIQSPSNANYWTHHSNVNKQLKGFYGVQEHNTSSNLVFNQVETSEGNEKLLVDANSQYTSSPENSLSTVPNSEKQQHLPSSDQLQQQRNHVNKLNVQQHTQSEPEHSLYVAPELLAKEVVSSASSSFSSQLIRPKSDFVSNIVTQPSQKEGISAEKNLNIKPKSASYFSSSNTKPKRAKGLFSSSSSSLSSDDEKASESPKTKPVSTTISEPQSENIPTSTELPTNLTRHQEDNKSSKLLKSSTTEAVSESTGLSEKAIEIVENDSEESNMSKPVLRGFDANFSDRLSAVIHKNPSMRAPSSISRPPTSISAFPVEASDKNVDKGRTSTRTSSVSSNEELGPTTVASRIAQIGNKIPLGQRRNSGDKSSDEGVMKDASPIEPEASLPPVIHLTKNDTIIARTKGPARRAPSNMIKSNAPSKSALEQTASDALNSKPPLVPSSVSNTMRQSVPTPNTASTVSSQKTKRHTTTLSSPSSTASNQQATRQAPAKLKPDTGRIKKSIFDSSTSEDDDFLMSKSSVVKGSSTLQTKNLLSKSLSSSTKSSTLSGSKDNKGNGGNGDGTGGNSRNGNRGKYHL